MRGGAEAQSRKGYSHVLSEVLMNFLNFCRSRAAALVNDAEFRLKGYLGTMLESPKMW